MLRAVDTPPIDVEVVEGTGAPVRGGDAVFAAAREIFGGWRGDEPRPALPAIKRFNAPQIRFVHDSDSQMALQIAFLGLRRGDPRFMALRLVRRLLAGGGSEDLSFVGFEPGTARLTDGGRGVVDKVAKARTDRPALKMTVTGASDPQSEREAIQRAALDARIAAGELAPTFAP